MTKPQFFWCALISSGIVLFGILIFAGLNQNLETAVNDVARRDSTVSNSIAKSNNFEMPGEVPEKPLMDGRVFPQGEIDCESVKKSRQKFSKDRISLSARVLPSAKWIQRGPLKIEGRVTDIAVDPRDENVVYIAAADGGVFKTTDGGSNWAPIFDDVPTMSIGALALDPINPDIVYVGTGEANPSADSLPGSGLYKSINGGATWKLLGLEDSGRIGRIVIHPTNPSIIHVAVGGYVWTTGPDRGVYRTTDGGKTWNRALFVDDRTGAIDIVQRNDDPDVLFASTWERYRTPGDRVTGGFGSGVHKSRDGGKTWRRIENGLPEPSEEVGRIGLSISQTNPDVMVYVYALTSGSFGGVYRTTDGGDSWTQVNDESLSNVHSSFGWWFGNIRIDPNDQDTFWVLGLETYRTTDGGNRFGLSSSGMHVDHHAMAFGSGDNPKIYAGNDGGVYFSTNGGASFQKTTGDLPITAAYRVAATEWNSNALWLGTQDNGSNEELDGDGVFNFIFGGDGFEVVPYLEESLRLWAQFQFGNVFYRNEFGEWLDARAGLFGRRNWNAPHAQDPNDPDTRYFGTNFVFRNDGDTAWIPISPDLTDGDQTISTTFGTLTTIGVSPANSDVIWSGADDGNIHVTTNGGVDWTKVSKELPMRWVTSVRPHPTNENECLVSLSGFQWGEDMAHIYRTTDTGQSWSAVDGNLPDMPVNDVMFDPQNTDRYFAATDLGVYQTFNNGEDWRLFGQGMPAVSVYDFAFRNNTRELVAGTHGRSLFTIRIPEVYVQAADFFDGDVIFGDHSDLLLSDDNGCRIRSVENSTSPMSVRLQGNTLVKDPESISLMLNSRAVGNQSIRQTVRLLNHKTREFEEIESLNLSAQSVERELKIKGDLSRFIEPESGNVVAQLTFRQAGGKNRVEATIDKFYWHIVE